MRVEPDLLGQQTTVARGHYSPRDVRPGIGFHELQHNRGFAGPGGRDDRVVEILYRHLADRAAWCQREGDLRDVNSVEEDPAVRAGGVGRSGDREQVGISQFYVGNLASVSECAE